MIWLIWILASVVAALFFTIGRMREELDEVRQMAIEAMQLAMDDHEDDQEGGDQER